MGKMTSYFTGVKGLGWLRFVVLVAGLSVCPSDEVDTDFVYCVQSNETFTRDVFRVKE